jgi:hypothetical protein
MEGGSLSVRMLGTGQSSRRIIVVLRGGVVSDGDHVYIFVSPSIISILGKLNVINLEKNASEYDVSHERTCSDAIRSTRARYLIGLQQCEHDDDRYVAL